MVNKLLNIATWWASLESKDIITLIGIVVTLCVSVYSLIVGIVNSKRTIYINSVTTSRTKYINDLKEYIAEFLGLVNYYVAGGFAVTETAEGNLQKIDRLRFLIKFQLNAHHFYDAAMIKTVDRIVNIAKPGMTILDPLHEQINLLTELTQASLKFEWEGIKYEAKKGSVSKDLLQRNTILYLNRPYEKFKQIEERDSQVDE